VGAGTSLSLLRTLGDAYRIARLRGFALNALDGLYLATRAGAQALGIADRVGALEPGMEADMVVLDLCSTPLLAHRMRHCRDLEEALFAQMILADDRAIRATWVAGRCLYERADRVS
jgi:guanine deaminase